MKRPCFALTLLLASLAGSLLAVGSAKCQSELDPAPNANWHGEACPLAPTESSGSLGLAHDEDARWQAHESQENLEYLRNYDEPTPAEVTTPESTPAQVEVPQVQAETPVETPIEIPAEAPIASEPAASEPARTTETVPDYSYRNDYDREYDYEFNRPATSPTPVEVAPVVEDAAVELDPYWTENRLPADVSSDLYQYGTEEQTVTPEADLDPYWTQEVPSEVASEIPPATPSEFPAEISNNVVEELDPYWTKGNEPATVTEQSVQPETATVDPEWAKDSVESVEAWIEKLNRIDEPAQPQTEAPATPVEPQAEPAVEKPIDNTDSTYGAHLWDDCELGHKNRRNCEYPFPHVSNYSADPVPLQVHVVTPAEQREWLLNVARSLNDVGVAFQTASQTIVRIADEAAIESAPVQQGTEAYPD